MVTDSAERGHYANHTMSSSGDGSLNGLFSSLEFAAYIIGGSLACMRPLFAKIPKWNGKNRKRGLAKAHSINIVSNEPYFMASTVLGLTSTPSESCQGKSPNASDPEEG